MSMNINMNMNGNMNVNVNVNVNVMGSVFACFELATRAGDGTYVIMMRESLGGPNKARLKWPGPSLRLKWTAR